MGYRIDWQRKRIFLTGAFYFKTSQSEALVFVNGKLMGKTDVLRKALTIKNLLPKTYKVEIVKEGFFPWVKELEIREGAILPKTQILLIRRNINFHHFPQFRFEERGGEEQKECDFEIKEKIHSQEKCRVFELGEKEFVLSNGSFYHFNKKEKSLEKIIEGVKSFKVFPEKNQILVFNNSELWLAGEKEIKFLARSSENLEDAIFLDPNYFVFSTQNKIFVGEMDLEGGQNLYQISEFGAKKMILLKKNQILIENERGIFLSDPLF